MDTYGQAIGPQGTTLFSLSGQGQLGLAEPGGIMLCSNSIQSPMQDSWQTADHWQAHQATHHWGPSHLLSVWQVVASLPSQIHMG